MMSLSRLCHSDGGYTRRGADAPPPSIVMAPKSALGTHSCVALSSAWVTNYPNTKIHDGLYAVLLRVLSYGEATILFRVLFLVRQYAGAAL